MNPSKYTAEMIADIQNRELKAIEMLKELQLSPAANVMKVNLGVQGKDVFADLVTPYLQDTKYTEAVKGTENKVAENASETATPEVAPAETPTVDPTNAQPQA